MAKFLLTQILRYLHDQFFTLIEIQTPADNTAAIDPLRGLGFEQVDAGHLYRRDGYREQGLDEELPLSLALAQIAFLFSVPCSVFVPGNGDARDGFIDPEADKRDGIGGEFGAFHVRAFDVDVAGRDAHAGR